MVLKFILLQFEFPSCDLTSAEMELVNAEPAPQDIRRRHSSVSTESWRHETNDSGKVMTARTVESLTNEMVSSIIGEVTQRRGSADKLIHSGSDLRTHGESDANTTSKDAIAAR